MRVRAIPAVLPCMFSLDIGLWAVFYEGLQTTSREDRPDSRACLLKCCKHGFSIVLSAVCLERCSECTHVRRYQSWLALRDSWRQTKGVSVQCTDAGGLHLEFDQNLKIMEHSKFCLALPGDSASTRRLSEIFLAGACSMCHVPDILTMRPMPDLLAHTQTVCMSSQDASMLALCAAQQGCIFLLFSCTSFCHVPTLLWCCRVHTCLPGPSL